MKPPILKRGLWLLLLLVAALAQAQTASGNQPVRGGDGSAVAGFTPQHNAVISWTNNGTVTSNRVYRSTTSGTGYALLATVAVTLTPGYTDSSVVAATTYYYVVTAVNDLGESAYSNEAIGVVP